MNIVFFGTSGFGAIVLKKLAQASFLPVLVVTTPDMPSGRKLEFTPPPVKISAQKYSIRVLQPEILVNSKFEIRNSKPDLFVVAAYGKILPKEILDIPAHGTLNVHPSLLPKYRGPSPVQTAILNGEKETGVTIMFMDEKIDHGAILTNSKLQITNNKYTYTELHNKLAELGAELLIGTIPSWLEGKITPVPQDESRATYTKIMQKEDGRIDWKKDAVYIERQVRALNPWPGTYTTFQGKLLKILKAKVLKQPDSKKLGEIFKLQTREIAVQTKEDALVIEELQLEGGRPTSSKEFLLGHKEIINTQLS